jgi:hypothetical protein
MSSKDKYKNKSSSKERFKDRVKKSLLATWENLENDSDGDADENENLALMAKTSEDSNSETESESDSDEEQEVYSNQTQSELIHSLKIAVKHYTHKSMQYKTLKDAYDALNECALVLHEENEAFKIRICDFEQNYVPAKKFNDDHEDALHEFIRCSFNRSKIASMIYNVSRNKGEGIGYSHFKNWDKSQQSSWEGEIPPELYSTFVKSGT